MQKFMHFSAFKISIFLLLASEFILDFLCWPVLPFGTLFCTPLELTIFHLDSFRTNFWPCQDFVQNPLFPCSAMSMYVV